MIKEYELLKLGQNVKTHSEQIGDVKLFTFDYGYNVVIILGIRLINGIWAGNYEDKIKFSLTAWGVMRALLIEALQVHKTLQYAQTEQIPINQAFRIWVSIGKDWDAIHWNNTGSI